MWELSWESFEGLKTGKSTLVGALVGDLAGTLVGPLVGPLVMPLVDPLVGRGSLSPALCVAHLSRSWNFRGRESSTNSFSQTIPGKISGYPAKIPGYPAKKNSISWFRGTYRTFRPPPLHEEDPHRARRYPDLTGTGVSQRDSRESFAIDTPVFVARQADSPESLEFPIRANHPIRGNHATKIRTRKFGFGFVFLPVGVSRGNTIRGNRTERF